MPRALPALLALFLLAALPLQAQPAAKTADEQWSDLVQLAKSLPRAASTRAEAAPAKAAQKAYLRTVAREAEKFTRDHPAHPQAAEARRWKAKSDLTAALLGAEAPTATEAALATEVRRDARLPVAARYEVAFLAEMAGETARHLKDRAAALAAREQSARTLIAEFPGQPGGYGLLLQVAGRGTGASAATAARDLLASAAPSDIKAAAQDLLDRQALVGQTLATATAGVLGAAQVFEPARDKPLILYTWSPGNPGSIGLAKELARLAPAGAVIIGLNLGRDVPAAQAVAAQLPGVQLYDSRGFDSPLVRPLRLTTAPLVILVDRSGVIRSTDAQNDLAAQLAGLGGPR